MCGVVRISNGYLAEGMVVTFHTVNNRMVSTATQQDSEGVDTFVKDGIVLCYHRFTILDPIKAGAKPMQLGDNRLMIVYNGECYNF